MRIDTLGSPPFPAIAESIRETLIRIGIKAQRVSGPNFDHVWYRVVTKESAAAPP